MIGQDINQVQFTDHGTLGADGAGQCSQDLTQKRYRLVKSTAITTSIVRSVEDMNRSKAPVIAISIHFHLQMQ